MRIAILAYEGCIATEIFGVADILLMASHTARAFGNTEPAIFDVKVIGLAGRTVKVAGGIPVGVTRPAGVFDLLIVPGFDIRRADELSSKLQPLSRELAYIRKTFSGGTRACHPSRRACSNG